MKGTIIVCLRDMLLNKYGVSAEDWREILGAAELDRNMVLLLSADVEDAKALALVGEVQQRYFSRHEELADAFGLYWCVDYAPEVYPSIYRRMKSARDFIMSMDGVHVQVTQSIKNAQPPRFQYEELGPDKLLVNYQSHRGLIHVFAGLCRGIGAYYGEKLEVNVLNAEQVSIEFLPA